MTNNPPREPVPAFHTYLTPAARRIHDTEIKSLVYETHACILCEAEWLAIPRPHIEHHVCTAGSPSSYKQHYRQIRFMTVRFSESLRFMMMASPIDDELRRRKIDAYALAMAGAFNYLVEKKLIAHGTFAKCFLLKGAILELNALYYMSVFVGANASKDELNAALVAGGHAPLFVSEGEEPSDPLTTEKPSTRYRYHANCDREGRPHANCSVCAEVEAAIAHADFKKLPPAQLDHLRQKAKHANFGVQLPDGMTWRTLPTYNFDHGIQAPPMLSGSDEVKTHRVVAPYPDILDKLGGIMTVKGDIPEADLKKFKEAWNEQLKTHPPLAEHSTYDSVPLVLKTLVPTSTLTRVFKFLCYLNSQDHSVAEQREHIAVTRELKAILEKKPND